MKIKVEHNGVEKEIDDSELYFVEEKLVLGIYDHLENFQDRTCLDPGGYLEMKHGELCLRKADSPQFGPGRRVHSTRIFTA